MSRDVELQASCPLWPDTFLHIRHPSVLASNARCHAIARRAAASILTTESLRTNAALFAADRTLTAAVSAGFLLCPDGGHRSAPSECAMWRRGATWVAARRPASPQLPLGPTRAPREGRPGTGTIHRPNRRRPAPHRPSSAPPRGVQRRIVQVVRHLRAFRSSAQRQPHASGAATAPRHSSKDSCARGTE